MLRVSFLGIVVVPSLPNLSVYHLTLRYSKHNQFDNSRAFQFGILGNPAKGKMALNAERHYVAGC